MKPDNSCSIRLVQAVGWQFGNFLNAVKGPCDLLKKSDRFPCKTIFQKFRYSNVNRARDIFCLILLVPTLYECHMQKISLVTGRRKSGLMI